MNKDVDVCMNSINGVNICENKVKTRIQNKFAKNKNRVEDFLDNIIPSINDKLFEAMRYVVFNEGKRLRPSLTYIIGEILQSTQINNTHVNSSFNQSLDSAAASIELIHCYSLVHDDLPAMDDDDLRRGKPTCHKKFDEATAILAGDALQTLAFEILSDEKANPINDKFKVQMIKSLANASGAYGMVKGQMQDMDAEGKQISISDLENLHLNKTGKLITASIHLGILVAEFEDEEIIKKLLDFGNILGVLFQIQDDILDETSTSDVMGKPLGSDKKNNKTTYISLLGVDGAKQKAIEMSKKAVFIIDSLRSSNENGYLRDLDLLKNIVCYFLNRKK